jgi:hypothetical protein
MDSQSYYYIFDWNSACVLAVQSKMPFTILGVVGIIITVVSVILCVVIGLGMKRGKENVDKIIQLVKAQV